MATLNFNSNEVEPSIGIDAIPAGKYTAVISNSEMKPTRNGSGQYLELTFEIIEGEYKNRKVWARLNLENQNAQAVQIARADLSAICRAVNVPAPRDSAELHNLPLVITVRSRKNPESGEISNDIKGYAARGALDATVKTIPAPQTGNAARPPWERK